MTCKYNGGVFIRVAVYNRQINYRLLTSTFQGILIIGGKYYAYVIICVDNLIVSSNCAKSVIRFIGKVYTLKE